MISFGGASSQQLKWRRSIFNTLGSTDDMKPKEAVVPGSRGTCMRLGEQHSPLIAIVSLQSGE